MSINLIKEFTVRAATMDDIPAIVELENADSLDITGEPSTDESHLRAFFERPNLNIDTDVWLVHTPAGKLVGYGVFSDRAPHVNLWAWSAIHPDYRDQGIGDTLIELAEDRAREVIPLAPSDARIALYRNANTKNKYITRLLPQHGYRSVRHSWRMKLELEAQPPAPVYPAGVRLRAIDPARDALTIYRTVEDCFSDHWGYVAVPEEEGFTRLQHHMHTAPNFDPTLWFLAVQDTPDGEDIAGVILCAPFMPNDPAMAYISTVGVTRDWRRQGVALAMLHSVFGELYRRGIARVALHVDAQSLTGATRLYEKAGMHVDQHYEEFEKELRPGQDLMTRTVED
ncbi:MAG: GNAT family N-acetyltransferase [Anaerolineae bacterium]|nr:GNAT family N-acetyltransferase [Anaerolineae bacterium]